MPLLPGTRALQKHRARAWRFLLDRNGPGIGAGHVHRPFLCRYLPMEHAGNDHLSGPWIFPDRLRPSNLLLEQNNSSAEIDQFIAVF